MAFDENKLKELEAILEKADIYAVGETNHADFKQRIIDLITAYRQLDKGKADRHYEQGQREAKVAMFVEVITKAMYKEVIQELLAALNEIRKWTIAARHEMEYNKKKAVLDSIKRADEIAKQALDKYTIPAPKEPTK